MAVIHPSSPNHATGSNTNGTDLQTDLVNNTGIASVSGSEITDDDGSTSPGSSTDRTEQVIFDSYITTNEIWVKADSSVGNEYIEGVEVHYTDDGGTTWTKIASIEGNYWDGNQWGRFRFDALTMDGIKIRAYVTNFSYSCQVFEVEAHKALIPDNATSTLNADEYYDDDILETTATVVDKNGDPVPNISADVTITDEDGNQIASDTKTSDSNGEVTYSDITDIDADYTGDTEYELEWNAGGYKTFQPFYVLPDAQQGNESVVQVYSQNGNPVRNAEVYVDGEFMGYTDTSGELGIRYVDFPTKGSGSYEFIAVKGNRGVAKTVANNDVDFVKFGRANAEETDSLDTSESRYSNVY